MRAFKYGTCRIEGCNRARHNAHSSTCNYHNADGSRSKFATDRERGKKHDSRARISLTPEEWVAIYEAQGGKCGICRHKLYNRYSTVPRNKKVERVAACDHDHVLEKNVGVKASVRGLLCAMPCNKMFTYHMTQDWLSNALWYSRAPYLAQQVIQGMDRSASGGTAQLLKH